MIALKSILICIFHFGIYPIWMKLRKSSWPFNYFIIISEIHIVNQDQASIVISYFEGFSNDFVTQRHKSEPWKWSSNFELLNPFESVIQKTLKSLLLNIGYSTCKSWHLDYFWRFDRRWILNLLPTGNSNLELPTTTMSHNEIWYLSRVSIIGILNFQRLKNPSCASYFKLDISWITLRIWAIFNLEFL